MDKHRMIQITCFRIFEKERKNAPPAKKKKKKNKYIKFVFILVLKKCDYHKFPTKSRVEIL